MSGLTVQRSFKVAPGRARRASPGAGDAGPLPAERVPRVARMMALAIRLDGLIQSGAVRDQAEVARLAHVTRARVTQIMNLLNLAPDIQEALLFLPPTATSQRPLLERELRLIAAEFDWARQRAAWGHLLHEREIPTLPMVP